MDEVWKDVEGYEGLYQISNKGRLRHLGSQRYPGVRIKTLRTNQDGYYRMQLSKHHKSKGRFIHRLVALAFIPNPENKPEVNHINGDKLDNRVENLEWCTNLENIRHAWKNGLVKGQNHGNYLRGKDAHNARPIKALDDCGNVVATYDCITDASKAIGVGSPQIVRVLKGRRHHTRGLKFQYA